MSIVRRTAYRGTMSQGARKRLTKSLTLMAMATKPMWIHNPVTDRLQHHHLSFVTLTIAHNKNLASPWCYANLLAPFLQWLRDTKDVKCYVWKCEKQKRGQIHYHIVIPNFIIHTEIRRKWNGLQRKAGLLEEYALKHGHYRPPSTEIKAKKPNEMKYLVKDIVKEMAKSVDAWELEIADKVDEELAFDELNIPRGRDFEHRRRAEIERRLEERVSLEGKTWDCSLNLSRAKYYTITATHDHFDKLEQMSEDLIIKQEDWFSIITFKGEGPPGILNAFENWELDNYLQSILN